MLSLLFLIQLQVLGPPGPPIAVASAWRGHTAAFVTHNSFGARLYAVKDGNISILWKSDGYLNAFGTQRREEYFVSAGFRVGEDGQKAETLKRLAHVHEDSSIYVDSIVMLDGIVQPPIGYHIVSCNDNDGTLMLLLEKGNSNQYCIGTIGVDKKVNIKDEFSIAGPFVGFASGRTSKELLLLRLGVGLTREELISFNLETRKQETVFRAKDRYIAERRHGRSTAQWLTTFSSGKKCIFIVGSDVMQIEFTDGKWGSAKYIYYYNY